MKELLLTRLIDTIATLPTNWQINYLEATTDFQTV
jgi:hypothetical protein